jgi:glycogen(starch) synthase
MNIAIFASAFYPHVGGVEELCRQLAHAYQGAGHRCIVLTNRWPRSLPKFEEYEGIPVYRLAMRVPEGSLKARANYRLTHNSIRREMLVTLRRHEIDVLHVQCVSSNGYYALLAKRELGLPLVVTTQGERTMDAGRLYEKSPFANRVLRGLLNEADAISACSENTLNDLEQWYGSTFDGRSRVIYNGIRLADFDTPVTFEHRRPYILGIGRLVPQKGFDVLIRAYAMAGIESHDLLIAGEGAERGTLEALAVEMGVDSRVRFVGRADRTQAVALFSGCEFFVLPSRMEPLGIVNLEAMAAGKAVIASRVGGVPEIVEDGETGLLVAAEDATELAGAIRRLGSDQGLRERLGVEGRRRAKTFDWDAIAEQYLDLYFTCSLRGATLCK